MSPESETVAPAGAVRAALDLQRLPWIRPLVAAYVNDYPSVASLFAGNPADASVWRDTLSRVAAVPRDRAGLVDILTAQMADRDAPAAARAGARALADPASVAVVTGQQAGLFGGPLYTLFKAVSTIQIARRVAAEQQATVVPVFWVEGDDHDWAEVRATTVLDSDGQTRSIALADGAGAGLRPVAQISLDQSATDAIAALRDALSPTEFTEGVLSTLSACYAPGTNLSRALACWLDALLGDEGLVVFEAHDDRAKRLSADVIARELEGGGIVSALAREAGERMKELGHSPQVEPGPDATGVFYVSEHGRQPVKRAEPGWTIGGEPRGADLAGEARAHPERFSPNVLLRPLVQDRLFPTAAYVGGPSELAYQAQIGAAYRAFGLEPPLLCPRGSATVLDTAAVRFLEKSGIAFEALQPQDESALNARLQALLPSSLDPLLDDLDQQLVRGLDKVREATVSVDPTLAGAVETTVGRVRETLKTLHGKIVQAAKRKDDTLRRQFHRTRVLAFPEGTPQERLLGVAWFVNRYGPAAATRLIDVLPADAGHHYLLVL